jgi:ubiquitin C-terminal hydrolase
VTKGCVAQKIANYENASSEVLILVMSSDANSLTGCVGLMNQSASRHLNAILQCLYHIRAFRRCVYELPTETDDPNQSIPLNLQIGDPARRRR